MDKEKTYKKILSIIDSCKSMEHLESCIRIVYNYNDIFKCEESSRKLIEIIKEKTI